ncbi:MAG TPA: glycosyltransferase family 39 protein [Candidatus Binataceae bacterium]|nr:glycosyltransferase family 39 protein [Candidatus Binataceae bacterium]
MQIGTTPYIADAPDGGAAGAAPRPWRLRAQAVPARLLRFRIEIILIVVLGGLALGSGMSAPPLVDWDEATYVEVAHEAIANHSYLDFTWNGQAYVKKPPLLFWALIGSFKVFGESEFAARLPSVVAGLATLLLIYLTAAGAAGRLAGTLAALVPLQFYFFIARGGRDCATDAPLLFFLTLALYAILRAREDRRFCALAGAASGLAILSKGLAGTIPLIIAPLAVFVLPGFEAIGSAGLAIVFGCALAVAAPWYLYEALFNPLFWTSFVQHETLARVARHLEDETHSGWYTLHGFWQEIRFLWPLSLPAGALAVAAIGRGTVRKALVGGARRLRSIAPAASLWIVWLAVALGAACAVQTKLPWYVLPALVPTALLTGTLAARALEYRGPMRGAVAGLAALALALILVRVPARWRMIALAHQNERLRSTPSYVMGLKARRVAALHDGGRLYFAGVELPTMVYYSRMHCEFIKAAGGLEPIAGAGGPPRLDRNDLALVDPQGNLVPIANLGSEWNISGPKSPR